MEIQVLLVEDSPDDMRQLKRDLPAVFHRHELEVAFHAAASFEEAAHMLSDKSRRYDLILSDTYRGEQSRGDAAVLDMVNDFRGNRFCPLVVFSASARPAELQPSAFVIWAEKAEDRGIEKAIEQMLATGIPQAARHLHDELDRLAGSYLWEFLEENWEQLKAGGHIRSEMMGRLVRRRAALQLAELVATEAGVQQVSEVHGLEFYIYPPLNLTQYSLGEIVRSRKNKNDVRVILTPHCYLALHPGQPVPRAEFIQTVKAVPVKSVLGEEKIGNAKAALSQQRDKKLKSWVTPPSGQDVGKPEGRYWYLPSFLDIPHMYCDFMQTESLPYKLAREEFDSVCVLSPPYAESLQACYGAFYGAVGIPNVRPASIVGFLD
ncbi:response regulator [Corallococcus sp. AB030]|uniref:response regulator n=1 Tax=Corallococcus sp. AB030 TaxID=2316716 RepID=UPI0011E5A540|nr:response regulator [Corallococcus sp. AB030]